MKAELITKKGNTGFSTIDALMALAILSVSITSIIPLTFGGQSMFVDSETNLAAISLATNNVELAKDQLKANFNVSSVTASGTDPFYDDRIDVTAISPCSKSIKSLVEWSNDSRDQSLQVNTLITDPVEAQKVGGYCDPSPPAPGWDAPTSFDILSAGDFAGKGTGIAVTYINGTRYTFLTTDTNTLNSDNFYAIDVSDPKNTTSDDIASVKVKNKGLNGIVVSGNYAFVIYNDVENQLMVVDISNPLDLKLVDTASRTLPNMTAGVNPIGVSIFYYDDKIYIGTEYLAFGSPGENEEFHIFDVSNPEDPIWQSSINVDRRINRIAVRGGIAYLATGSGGDNTPLKIYNLNSLTKIGEFINSNNWNGKSLYLLGNKLYLGLERQSPGSQTGPEFHIFNISNPSNLDELGSEELNLAPSSSAGISAIAVQGNLAFLMTTDSNDKLIVMDVSDPSDLTQINTCPSDPIPQIGTGIIYLDDYLFASIKDNLAFRIIYSGPSCSQ